MKKLTILLITISVLCIPCTAQIVFNRTYDNQNSNDRANSLLPLKDGGYLIGGASWFSPVFASILIKTNINGDTIWQRTYDPTIYGENINHVIYAIDSNYIVTGTTQDSSNLHSAAMIMKIDTAGNIIWTKSYGGFYNEVGYDIMKTQDNGYIMAGWTSSNTIQPNPNLYEDGYVVKIDSLGNIEWENQFGDSLPEIFLSVNTAKDGGYILCGYTFSYGNNGDLWIVKIDSSGNYQWDRRYGGPLVDNGEDVIQTLDGGYLIAGNIETSFQTNSNAYVVKTDSLGNFQWDKQFDFSDYEIFLSINQNPDSNYYLLGTANVNFVEGFLMKINPQGDSLWTKFYRNNPVIQSGIHHSLYSMEVLNNGYIAMCGMTQDFNSIQKNNIWLVIADSLGCADSSCITTTINDPFQISLNPIIIYPNPTKDKIIINYSLQHNKVEALKIINATGKMVFKTEISPLESVLEINLHEFTNGVYALIITDDLNNCVQKFILNR